VLKSSRSSTVVPTEEQIPVDVVVSFDSGSVWNHLQVDSIYADHERLSNVLDRRYSISKRNI